MLKVSGNGKWLMAADGVRILGGWQEPETFYIDKIAAGEWLPEDARCLADFIKAGPPKKRYRIVKTFEGVPVEVLIKASTPVNTVGNLWPMNLTASDVEEV